MLDRYEATLDQRLRQAEEAEGEIQRLQSVADEAPQLRLEKSKRDLQTERERVRGKAMEDARREVEASIEKQTQVPALLGKAAAASYDLYSLLQELDFHRNEATRSLAVADQVDYEVELEETEEQENALNRSTKGLDWALAGHHGETQVKKLLDELGPGFHYFLGCQWEGLLTRDIANFILDHAVPQNGAAAQQDKEP